MIEGLPGNPQVSILLVNDSPAERSPLRKTLEGEGYHILNAVDCAGCLRLAAQGQPDLVILDVARAKLDGCATCRRLKLSPEAKDIPVMFISVGDRPREVLDGFEAGGIDCITQPFQPREMLMRVATHVRIYRLAQELRRKNALLESEINRRHEVEAALQKADAELSVISEREAKRWGLSGFVGRSPAFQSIVMDIRRLQKFPGTSVLVTGESGTGKELIARAIHYGSELARGPFVPVNCGAIPHELAESAIFGHTQGAFSGATADHQGYFAQAHRGTLFLDEIGEMPLGLQVKMLRVLEDRQLVPVGATSSQQMEVRLLAGTNADLEAAVGSGRFREDLYFRLARFTIHVPPLRDRKEDIPMLMAYFLRLFSAEMGVAHPAVDPATLAALQAYDYPGNIRELKNLVERALIESDGAVIQPEHLHFTRRPHPNGKRPADSPPAGTSAAHPAGHDAPGPDREEDELGRVVAFVREHGSINNSQCRHVLTVGLQHACYLLRKAHHAGLLLKKGTGRWTNYLLP
jgi:DNA-binding NtrC family response regulator